MEKSYSVCSPRRIMSVSKKRREATVSFVHSDIKASGFHGPKPAEVYGFVGSITTVVVTVVLLVWAYVPESWLHWIVIFYYPSRYWALIVPVYAMMTVILALVFYCGLNFMSTPPPSSLLYMMSLVGILQALVKLPVMIYPLSPYLISIYTVSIMPCLDKTNQPSGITDLHPTELFVQRMII